MQEPLFANSLMIVYIVAMIVVPLFFGIIAFGSATHATEGPVKRIGMELKGESPLPISRVCPNCGSSNLESYSLGDQFFINFDRRCSDCQTKFALPTPIWLSLLWIVLGIVAVIVGVILSIYVGRKYPDSTLVAFLPFLFGVGIGSNVIFAGIGKVRILKQR